MATISGTVQRPDGTLYANGRVEFRPINTPVWVSGVAVFTTPVYATTDENGEFSITLKANRYAVDHVIKDVAENQVGPLIIRVPNDTAEYDFSELVESAVANAGDFGGTPEAVKSFATIVVAGQSNVVADSSTDTLTLAAGDGVTLTTNATTDTVTISASGGGGGGSGDVVGPASATDNAIARFDSTTGKLLQNSAATIADTTGDITAGKYNSVAISGSSTPALSVTGTAAVSGTNTGDQDLSSYATSASVTSAIATHSAAADPHADRAFATSAVNTHAAVTSSVHGISTFGASLVDDADATAARTTLGLGTAATTASTAYESSGSIATHAAVTSSVHGITAAAATVLDDPTVSAMVDTLGGASATGTGGLVRTSSPTLATPVINGLPTGTGVASAATASTLAARDANGILTAVAINEGYTTTATAAGTTTLTVASNKRQYFTGSTTQTVLLPVASTLTLGHAFEIENNSTGIVTVQSSGANTILAMPGNTRAVYTCILTSGTTAASWAQKYDGFSAVTGTGSAVLAASPTITGTLTASSATSVLLGTAGSAVGSVGFRNATSGTITVAPTTGALGTVTLTLPAVTATVCAAATSTTTTQALFATATAGSPAFRALAAGDLPATLTSGTAITNAALTTPTLGTPASGTLTNCTSIISSTGSTTAAISNSAAETSVFSFSVPGGTLGTNGAVRVVIHGQMLQDVGSGQGYTLRIKYGATTMYAGATNATLFATSATRRAYRMEFILASDGTTGTQRVFGTANNFAPATTATTGYTALTSTPEFAYEVGGTAAVDSTTSQTFDITIQLTAANVSFQWFMLRGIASRI